MLKAGELKQKDIFGNEVPVKQAEEQANLNLLPKEGLAKEGAVTSDAYRAAKEAELINKASGQTSILGGKTASILDNIETKPDLFQFSRRYEQLAQEGYVPEKVEGLSKIFDINELKPIEVGVFDKDIKYTLPTGKVVEIKAGKPTLISGHNRLQLIKENIAKIENVDKYVKVKNYPGTAEGVQQAIRDSILTNVRNKSIKEIELLDNAINGLLDISDLARALDFNKSKISFFTNIIKTFRYNGLISFWNSGVAPKLATLKNLDFSVLQERLNFVERIGRRTIEVVKTLTPEQAILS